MKHCRPLSDRREQISHDQKCRAEESVAGTSALTSYANNLFTSAPAAIPIARSKIRDHKEELPGKRLEDSRLEESFEALMIDDIKDFVSSSAQCFLHHGRR